MTGHRPRIEPPRFDDFNVVALVVLGGAAAGVAFARTGHPLLRSVIGGLVVAALLVLGLYAVATVLSRLSRTRPRTEAAHVVDLPEGELPGAEAETEPETETEPRADEDDRRAA